MASLKKPLPTSGAAIIGDIGDLVSPSRIGRFRGGGVEYRVALDAERLYSRAIGRRAGLWLDVAGLWLDVAG